MTPEEVRAKLRDTINALIKDEPEQATKSLHDVLAAKMRDRVNPPEPVDPAATPEPVDTDTTPEPKPEAEVE